MKIYLAGPLFSAAEREFNVRLAEQLRHLRHDVFLPQEIEQSQKSSRAIFESDVVGIDSAEIVVGNLDGADPDSGTSWELGYAYAKCKLIVVYRTDFRIFAGTDPINLMLTESAGAVLLDPSPSISTLAQQIDEEIKLLAERRATGQFAGPSLIKTPGVLSVGIAGRPLQKTPVYTHADK